MRTTLGTGSERFVRGAILASLVLLFLSLALQEIRSVDFWWQLRTGQWIVENGAVPTHDAFTYTAHGKEFIEVRWFFYVLTYLGWTLGGPALLIVAEAAILMAAYVVAVWPSRRIATNLPGAAIVALGIWAGSGRFIVRPEIVTFLMVAIFIVVLDAYRSGRVGKLVWALPAAQVVWSNTHTEFILGPIVAWIFVAGQLVPSRFGKRVARRARGPFVETDRGRQLPWVAAAVTAACFVNPYGVRGATFPLLLFREMHAGSVLGRVVEELRSPFGLAHWSWDIRAAIALFGVSAATFWLNRKRTDLSRLLVWAAVAYLAGQSIRNLALFAFVGLWAALRNLDETLAAEAPFWARRMQPATATSRALHLGLALSLIGFTWFVASDRYAVRFDPDRRFGLGVVPWYQAEAATRFLLSSGATPQLFHEMSDGCYLDWAAQGRFPTFIDGRHEVFGEAFIDEYLAVALARRDWESFADRWRIRTVMLLREELGALVDVLRQSPRWVLVYLDAREVVFVRDIPEHADLIRANRIDPRAPFAPRRPEPDEQPVGWRRAIGGVGRPWYSLGLAKGLIHMGAVESAIPYLERAHRAFPDHREVRLTLAQVYRSRGDEEKAAALLEGVTFSSDEVARMDQMLANIAMNGGLPAAAIAPLKRATAARSDDALLWALLGKASLDTGDLPGAAAAYRRATELSSPTADYWVGLGHALAVARDDAGALAAYAQVLRLDPERFTIHYNMGVLLRRGGNTAEAGAHFREAVRIRPDYQAARNALAELTP